VSTKSRKPSFVGSNPAFTPGGKGLGRRPLRRLKMASSSASRTKRPGRPATPRVTSSSALPGMQLAWHTSQSTLAWEHGPARLGGLGHVQLEGKQDFVFIAEIHQRAEGQAFGGGKLEGAGGDAFRQSPLHVRRLSGVAGVHPVDVPAGVDLEVEPGIGGLAAIEGGGGNDKLHMHMRGIGRRGDGPARAARPGARASTRRSIGKGAYLMYGGSV